MGLMRDIRRGRSLVRSSSALDLWCTTGRAVEPLERILDEKSELEVYEVRESVGASIPRRRCYHDRSGDGDGRSRVVGNRGRNEMNMMIYRPEYFFCDDKDGKLGIQNIESKNAMGMWRRVSRNGVNEEPLETAHRRYVHGRALYPRSGLPGWDRTKNDIDRVLKELHSIERRSYVSSMANQANESRNEVEDTKSDKAPEEKSGLLVTEKAVKRLKELQAESDGHPVFLRLSVEGGGCSGFQYEFNVEENGPSDDDFVFEEDGATVLCDNVSLEFLRGATVDFESNLMRSGFVVHDNPNALTSCGCGSSFAAK